jgi:hypothetical protein
MPSHAWEAHSLNDSDCTVASGTAAVRLRPITCSNCITAHAAGINAGLLLYCSHRSPDKSPPRLTPDQTRLHVSYIFSTIVTGPLLPSRCTTCVPRQDAVGWYLREAIYRWNHTELSRSRKPPSVSHGGPSLHLQTIDLMRKASQCQRPQAC